MRRRSKLKNLILISVDSLRHDAFGAFPQKHYLRKYGMDFALDTPCIDRLALEGFVFLGARSVSPATPAAHASLLTGQWPFHHGVRVFLGDRLSSTSSTLFEVFSNAGFESIASVDFRDLFLCENVLRGASVIHGSKEDETIYRFAKCAEKGKSVFLFAHMSDVHFPYCVNSAVGASDRAFGRRIYRDVRKKLLDPLSPSGADLPKALVEWSDKNGKSAEIGFPLYIEGVNRFDRGRLSRFLARLDDAGLLDSTLVVLVSDHGEALKPRSQGLNGERSHRFFHCDILTEELIRIPLILWSKDRRLIPRGSSDICVSIADVMPTVLEGFGLPVKNLRLDGTSRWPVVQGHRKGAPFSPSPCYAEAWEEDRRQIETLERRILSFFSKGEMIGAMPEIPYRRRFTEKSIRSGDYKLIESDGGTVRLLNTESDPWEECDLLAQSAYFGHLPWMKDYRSIATYLQTALRKLSEAPNSKLSPMLRRQEGGNSSAVLRKQLRHLGYL